MSNFHFSFRYSLSSATGAWSGRSLDFRSTMDFEKALILSLISVISKQTTRSAANKSYIIYLEQELIMASTILGLMAQKYGIQLEKTSNSPV